MDFDAFVETSQTQLQRAAWLLTGDWASAEDLTQEVLLRSWRRWNRLRGMARRDAYVRKMLVTTFLTQRRRRWNGERPTADFDEAPTSDPMLSINESIDLASLMKVLPPKQRTVVALRYVFDYTEADVAQLMGTSIGTVKSQHAKALHALRAAVELTSKG